MPTQLFELPKATVFQTNSIATYKRGTVTVFFFSRIEICFSQAKRLKLNKRNLRLEKSLASSERFRTSLWLQHNLLLSSNRWFLPNS